MACLYAYIALFGIKKGIIASKRRLKLFLYFWGGVMITI